MEFFLLGVVVTAAVMIGAYFIVRRVRRTKDADSSSSSSTNSASSRSVIRGPSLEEQRQARLEERQNETYRDLSNKYAEADTIEQHVALLREVENKRSDLSNYRYETLSSRIKEDIEAAEKDAQIRAEMAPKLIQFRALKILADNEVLFEQLHRILKDGDDPEAIIFYSDLEKYGEERDLEWLSAVYNAMLPERLKTLLETARTGTIEDYQKIRALVDDLVEYDYVDDNDDYIDAIIQQQFQKEWNEMVVRFFRDPGDEDYFEPTEPDGEEEIDALLHRARVEKDLLSLQMLRASIEDEDDVYYRFIELTQKELEEEVEQQLLALGLRPDEQESGV